MHVSLLETVLSTFGSKNDHTADNAIMDSVHGRQLLSWSRSLYCWLSASSRPPVFLRMHKSKQCAWASIAELEQISVLLAISIIKTTSVS
mmetsp:Transcript_17015/g.49162  ORF Transcript_17015/g.49162 Transcript_17015/m.49162 type:complete len:90 (+) Transcript_17015:304-573(+)